MALWCTKQSLAPPSGVMKPKPLASLNHFTVPVVRIALLLDLLAAGPVMPTLAASLSRDKPSREGRSHNVGDPPLAACDHRKQMRPSIAGPQTFTRNLSAHWRINRALT